jgi:two-component system CheB/CheR fusion protein
MDNDPGQPEVVAPSETRPPESLARQLEVEIERLKSRLRDTVEQQVAATEKLKASNEESQAMNEELATVNRELKSKVDELGQANSDMHNLMDATAIATVFLDRQLRITRYTPSAVALFNLVATDIGRPLTDLTTQLRYPSLATDAQNVLEALVSIEREVGQGAENASAGEIGGRWYLARLRPYRTIDDRIAGVVLSFVDITDRKHAQEALTAADARFRAVVGQATVGVLQTGLQGRITLANGQLCGLLGYSESELIGQKLEQLVHPDHLVEHLHRLQQLLERDESFEIEKRLLRRDGTPVWVHNAVTKLPATETSEGSVLAVCVDITERKAAEAALRNSEEHLRIVLENAHEYAIFTTDTDRRITGWSAGAQRTLGYTEQEATGRLADMIFTDDDRAAGVPAEEAAQASTDGRAGDDRFHQRKDGSLFWASGALMTMHDGEGRDVGFVKILRDQSDARRAQQALELSQGELKRALRENESARAAREAANVAKDRFLAVLSHELRTPLTPAMMALQMLSRRKELPQDVHTSVEMILRNIRAEARLIDDLLDLTRISRGTLELERAPVDLHQVIGAACEICEPDVRAKEQVLALDLRAPAHRAMGDGPRLQQVVWNLVKNASRFTPPHGEIRLATSVEDGHFVMTVSDHGIGIDAEALPRIFDAFVPGGAWVAREFGGLGLGLSISRATVEAHGGRLRVESPGRGQGATFTLELPLAEG